MSEQTKIIQSFLPPMVAGIYAVDVTQEVFKNDKSIQGIDKNFEFGVDAARFKLNPEDIYSVYPPANQYGRFSESLPHLVFSRRTLPWERTIDGMPPVFQRGDTPLEKRNPQESPPVPWMSLILLNEEEMEDLEIRIRTLNDIIPPSESDDIIRPEIFDISEDDDGILTLMPWEKRTDPCLTIDISKEQFEKHIPSMESLSYLAHAKEVSIEHKDKNGITDLNTEGEGVFSVIVGNRLPSPGKNHTAILVSLEGYADYLKDASTQKTIPLNNKVRLVVLANWKFNNSGEDSFLKLLNTIDIKSMKVDRGQEAPELLPYFDSGYVPLEHLTRVGARTLSWYHGPMIPKLSPTKSKSITFSSSDAALRYDKTTGFFDVSFAAAWQLGRMLALQNQGFSKAILKWRIEQKQETLMVNKKNKLNKILNDDSNISLKNKVINFLGQVNAIEVAPSKALPVSATSEIPEEVKDFLDHLYHLKGVPFSYLVPHEFLLEKEHTKGNKAYSGSLSLFYIDPNWIEALLDGALSIGRVNNTDTILEKAMSGNFIKGFEDQSRKNPNEKLDNISVRILNITGFLFRSNLISGWRGIEIQAFDADGVLLPALRFERIDADVFLGIFNGNVSSIIITQPYEGLHFGIKRDGELYQKNLKNEDGSNQTITDGSADLNTELNAGLITNGILDIAEIAKKMKQKLTDKGWMNTLGKSKGKYFTSAEFAYQMVDSPIKRTISIKMDVSNP